MKVTRGSFLGAAEPSGLQEQRWVLNSALDSTLSLKSLLFRCCCFFCTSGVKILPSLCCVLSRAALTTEQSVPKPWEVREVSSQSLAEKYLDFPFGHSSSSTCVTLSTIPSTAPCSGKAERIAQL